MIAWSDAERIGLDWHTSRRLTDFQIRVRGNKKAILM